MASNGAVLFNLDEAELNLSNTNGVKNSRRNRRLSESKKNWRTLLLQRQILTVVGG